MTQQELMKLKAAADKMGQWAVYLLTETEYWTPQALDELTEEKLQEFQTRQSQWLMENEANYPAGGAKEELRASITWQVRQDSRCLTEDEAFEMEQLRMEEEMTIEQLPQRLKEFRAKQEQEAQEDDGSNWLNEE